MVHPTQYPRVFRIGIPFFVALLSLAVSGWFAAPSASADSPINQLQQAWQLVAHSNTYQFDTHIAQTSYPLPSLGNVGRQPHTDDLYLSGTRDQSADLLELTLWQHARGDVENGLSVKTENGRTYRRNAAGEWEEHNGLGDLFAPGGDPLMFLQSAENVTALGNDTRQLGDLTFSYETIAFDLDTTTYAQAMRQQLEAQMAQYGQLPAGMTLKTPDVYRQMEGKGQLWLDETGLPRRLEMTLEMPPRDGQGRVTAVIVTDLSGFDMARVGQSAETLWQSPLTWVQVREANIVAAAQTGAELAAWLIVGTSVCLIVLANWRKRHFYTVVVLAIIFVMLFEPLFRVTQASQFFAAVRTAEESAETRQATNAAEAELQTKRNPTWNPNQDPLSPTFAPALQSNNAITDTTDSDGDGLFDVDEARWLTCAFAGSAENCDWVSDTTDSDDDGLSDGLEVYGLGTHPAVADTDMDGITDADEISGFTYAGQTWYLNPLEADSNYDGLIDGLECRARTQLVSSSYNATAICPDSDGDGLPDLFDDDNDNDGVPDSEDMSPFSASSGFYGEDNPLELSVDNLALDKPVFIDVQLRPQTTTNLNLFNHVLDWPSQDDDGQIQRLRDTTWANTDNLSLRSNTTNADNGDIRLVPMLEVTMPYANGHYANLPVLDSAPASRELGDPVANWLDEDRLAPTGIEVSDVDLSAGTIAAYVPLTQVTDRFGRSHAFGARMAYWPSQGTAGRANWGAAQELRIVWFVQMITDQCPAGYEDVREEVDGEISYACVDPASGATTAREDVLTIGHVYPDTWQLTGMTVSEEHDFDMAILHEDPALDPDLTSDDQLMVASWNLNSGFMIGRDCDSKDGNGNCLGDGNRDVTVENMAASVASWFTSGSYIDINTYLDYEHGGYLAYIIGTEVEPLLSAEFATDTIPTLMYAQDHTRRELNLDNLINNSAANLITADGNALTVDLSPTDVAVQVESSLSWTPYQFVDGAWRAAEINTYLTQLDVRLQVEGFFQSADSSDAAAEEAEYRRAWVQSYYAALWQGLTAWTELAGQPLTARVDSPLLPDTVYDPLFPPGTSFGATLLAIAFFDIVLFSNPQLPLTQLSFGWINSNVALVGFVMIVAITFVGLALLFSGNEKLVRTGEIILAAVTLVVGSIYAINAMIALVRAAQGAATAANSAASYQAVGAVGLFITLALIWVMFLISVVEQDMSQLAINVALSLAIASTIYLLILFSLSLVSLGVLGILLSLVDAIFVLLDKKGPSDYVIEFIANSLFDIDISVTNFDSADRLDIQLHDVGFQDVRQGFRETNSLLVTMGITNSIKYHRDLAGEEDKVAKRNVFTYTLQLGEETFEDDLDYWDSTSTDQWTPLSGRKLQTHSENTLVVPLADFGAGLNQPLGLNYTESFLSGANTCWKIPSQTGTVEICRWKKFRDAIHYPLSSLLVYDIFPATVAEFATMRWSDPASDAPPLSRQVDPDADGVSNLFGTDPGFGYDTDGDGLGDGYELANGTDPRLPDSDYDGLSDLHELRIGTNPLLQDTDGDGLNDRIEVVDGWLTLYNNGSQSLRVWSDPFRADSDGDGLDDLQEFVFAFNPWTETDPSIITELVKFRDLGVVEDAAPQLFLRFEDGFASTAFQDSSGKGNHVTCTTCPDVHTQGRYGQSVALDGADDFLSTNFVLDPSASSFTAATWFYVSDASNDPILLSQRGGGGIGRTWLALHADGTLNSFLGNSFLNGTTTVSSDEWHHAAITYDGTTLRLYLDGVLENEAARSVESADGEMRIGRHKSFANRHFAGRLDDVVIVDEAFSADAIADLMAGRINPNDDLLASNAQLTYQARVTNTSALTATGFLVAESTYADPAVRHPTAAYAFEPEQRLRHFANSAGDGNDVVCVDDGSCPAVINSVREEGLWFNGSTHTMRFPALSARTDGNQFNLSFWVNLNSYPAVGERMMLFDTDSDEEGAIDIYINSSGNVVVDVAGHPDGPSVDSRVLNLNNNHISLNGHYNLYINGNHQFLPAWLYTIDPDAYQIGPGTLGNSVDGSDPFYGQIDELVFYDDFREDSEISAAMGGNYNGHLSLHRFRADTISVGYDNLANDVRAATCPSDDACPAKNSGKHGSGILLDGVDDYLVLDTHLDPAVEPFTAAMWFKTTDYSNEPILLQQVDGDGIGRTWLGITADGNLYSFLGGSSMDGTTNVLTNTWHHAAVAYDGTTLRLYLDGIEEASSVRTLEANDGAMELGRHAAFSDRYFMGSLDEFVIVPTAISAENLQPLMHSSWPMIDIPAPFVPYSAAPQSTDLVSGVATVSPYAVTSQHRVDQEVEAALELQAQLTYPVVDPYASDLEIFIPFEDGPGSTIIDNLINYPGAPNDIDREALCLETASCPTLGLRGQADRAAYFDGKDDFLYLDTRDMSSYGPQGIQTIAAWVNAEHGTLLDFRFGSTSHWMTLDMNQFELLFADNTFTVDYDLPRNEWFHFALTIDNSDVVRVYVNGVEVATGAADLVSSSTDTWGYIGSSRFGHNYLQGYLDDFRAYSVPLSAADVMNLYKTSAPLLRFEFDEDADAPLFTDSSINEYIGRPRMEQCSTVTLDALTVDSLSTASATVFVDVGNTRLFAMPNVAAGDSLNVAGLETLFCGEAQITVKTISQGAAKTLGTMWVNVALPNSLTQTLSNGGDSVMLGRTVSAEIIPHPSPAPGTQGRIANGALFDGKSYIRVDNATAPNALTNDFTIMAWIRPQIVGGTNIQRIIAAGIDSSTDGFGFALEDGKLMFHAQGVQKYLSNVTLAPDRWQHVAVVFDGSNDAHFYLDGQHKQTINGTSPVNSNPDDPLFIGARINNSGNLVQVYQGMIDELAIYGRGLTQAELFGLYLRELRWYRDTATTLLTIDSDAPTVTLLSDAEYRPNGLIQLVVATSDPTSDVTLLDFGLKAPSDSAFMWQGATPCANSGGGAWCPTFDSIQLDGEGQYDVQFRVVDAVGNETLSAIDTIYVDDTLPSAASSYTGQWIQPTSENLDTMRWTFALSGTVNDPDLAISPTVAGSGVAPETLMIELIDSVVGGVEYGLQPATVNGAVWSIDYEMRDIRPNGLYTVAVSLADQVGNATTIPVGTVKLDERPPTVALNNWGIPTAISQSITISGTVHDVAAWGDEIVVHHFEEAASATVFYNTVNSQYYTPTHSTCTTCPTAGRAGRLGDGVQFDGVDDRIDLPFSLDPSTQPFAISVWFNLANTSDAHSVLQQLDGSGTGRSWLYIDGGKLRTHLGGIALIGRTSVTANAWHHAAVSFDGATLTLYLNGQLEATSNRLPESADGTLQLGANKTNDNHLQGTLDEFVLFDRALTTAEIVALSQQEMSGIGGVEVAITPQTFEEGSRNASLGWEPATLSDPDNVMSGWEYPLPDGLEGFYDITVRGVDGFGNIGRNQTVWRGLIDLIDPYVDITATHVYSNSIPQTLYTLTITDFLLDASSYILPCANADLITQYYDNALLPQFGIPYQVTATCRIDGHQAEYTARVCDLVGRCTSVTIEPGSAETTITRPVSTGNSYLFDYSGVEIEVVDDGGCLTDITVEIVSATHPNDTAETQDRYWRITPTGCTTGFIVNLTLPSLTNDGNEQLCRYDTNASFWECGVHSHANGKVTRNNVTQFSDWVVSNSAPTVVELVWFGGWVSAENRVTLEWETAAEIDHAGFNIYRRNAATRDAWTKVNDQLIASRGSMAQGATYQYNEYDVPVGEWEYVLEDVEIDGDTRLHLDETATVTVGSPTVVTLGGQALQSATSFPIFLTALLLLGLTLRLCWQFRRGRRLCFSGRLVVSLPELVEGRSALASTRSADAFSRAIRKSHQCGNEPSFLRRQESTLCSRTSRGKNGYPPSRA